MADSLVQNLTKRVLDSLANLTGVRLWSGKTGETDALGIEASEFISSDIVADTSVDYKALTPKGFYNSTMTTTRKGVGQLALDADVTAQTGTGLLNSVHQVLIKAQCFRDWFIANGLPTFYVRSQDDLSSGGAIAFNSVWKGDLLTGAQITLNPALPAGAEIDLTAAYVVLSSNTHAERLRVNISYSTSEVLANIGGAAWVGVSADNLTLFLRAKTDQVNLRVSINVNATVR